MFDRDEMYRILSVCTTQVRKGDVLVQDDKHVYTITEIFDMPAEADIDNPNEYTFIDCHFLKIAVHNSRAAQEKDNLIKLLDEWPNDQCVIAQGPSYIGVGGVLGDQGAAFMLFALGEVLGIWRVITPELLGMEGDQAHKAAGMGYIMCTGYNKEALQGAADAR